MLSSIAAKTVAVSSFQVSAILVLASSQMHEHEINSLKDFVHRISKTVVGNVILFLDVTGTMSYH